MNDCPFCPENWHDLDIIWESSGGNAILVPLNPVVDGHVLVIGRYHTTDAAEDPSVTSDLMFSAALWVKSRKIQANIITSIGPDATQTVLHTHLHVVPRRENDGLHLPWTGQVKP
ncbi:hypothetical protein B5566_02340 [Mycobacterium sp. MHSD3]|nr:hypothetical protein B5566_02340 [Mycobacterium sp. MHSD3]